MWWMAFLISLVLSTAFGFLFIPLLRSFRFRQTVRDDGPQSHLHKTGIPTMGGLIFIIPIVGVTLMFSDQIFAATGMLMTMLLFSGVGFIDDMMKILKKSKDGLSVLQKTILLLLISGGYTVYSVFVTDTGTKMIVPFSGMTEAITIPVYLYIPFLLIFLYLITNSVNLTDGVDGLAGSVTGLVLLFFFIVARAAGPGFENEQLMTMAGIAALLGFLFFNAHPAKVFMGDTGSMALGGLVGVLSIRMQIPWVILIVGIVYVVEALSVVIQVGHYKRTKRRVFKMAPIHHHYELSGWKEQKVVLVFSSVTIIAGVVSYLVLGMF